MVVLTGVLFVAQAAELVLPHLPPAVLQFVCGLLLRIANACGALPLTVMPNELKKLTVYVLLCASGASDTHVRTCAAAPSI